MTQPAWDSTASGTFTASGLSVVGSTATGTITATGIIVAPGITASTDPISRQLFEARLKANDFLQEHLKQVITLAGGTLVITVTFLKELHVDPAQITWGWLLPTSWTLLGISVLIGAITISMLVNHLDDIAQKPANSFAAGKSSVGLIMLVSFWAFGLGVLSLSLFGLLNYPALLGANPNEGTTLLSETQAIKIARSRTANGPAATLRKAELEHDAKQFSSSLLVWKIVLDVPPTAPPNVAASGAGGAPQATEVVVDAATGRVLKP
jgi:hypothetical protein